MPRPHISTLFHVQAQPHSYRSGCVGDRCVERLKAALRSVYADPCIDEIRAIDLCGDYPAVRYGPPEGFGFDIVTRMGEAFRFSELAVETKRFQGVDVHVVTPRQLWEMKRGTVRPIDHADAAALAAGFGLGEG